MSTRVDPEPLGSLGLGHVDLSRSDFDGRSRLPNVLKFEIRAHKGIYLGSATQAASGDEQELLLPGGSHFRVEGHVDAVVRELNGAVYRRHFLQLQQL